MVPRHPSLGLDRIEGARATLADLKELDPKLTALSSGVAHNLAPCEEAAPLTQGLHDIVENDRCPFSRRIRMLRGTLVRLMTGAGPRR
jgi:hypothetical protein